MPRPLPTVPHVDLDRYLGRWFEIARLPNRFERGCDAAVAEYSRLPDGKIRVVNICYGADGKPRRTIKGVASIADPQTNAKLKVTFFWPFRGDYWVLALDAGYRYALVGEPRRKYLWILSRAPELDDATYASLLQHARELGFAAERVERNRVRPRL